MTNLEHLTKISNQLKETERLSKHVTAKWATWNWWAKDQDWYVDWAYENGLRGSDLKHYRDYGVKIVKDREEGAPLLALRRQLYFEIEQLKLGRDELLQRLWLDNTPLEAIALANGKEQQATYRAISRSDWFRYRKELKLIDLDNERQKRKNK